jgi:uncharacterized membrane protein (UPF0127 family)
MIEKFYDIEKDGDVILRNVRMADSFFNRLKGLMLKKGLDGIGGLYLTPCNQIHTFMMRFCIDAIFLSRDNEVLFIANNTKPCRITPFIRSAAGVIETAPGFAGHAEIHTGDKIDFVRRG